MPIPERNFHWYKYTDDADRVWTIKVSNIMAEVSGLQQLGTGETINPSGSRHECRHMKLVEIEQRPGQRKYRCDVITNERNPLQVLNKEFEVNGLKMRCVRFVGEQWREH